MPRLFCLGWTEKENHQKLEDQNKIMALSGQSDTTKGRQLRRAVRQRDPEGYKRLMKNPNINSRLVRKHHTRQTTLNPNMAKMVIGRGGASI